MPRDTIVAVLHQALADTRADADQLIEQLTATYRHEETPRSTEQVIALGFLVCARALREASLVQEIAVREEIQELSNLINNVLVEVKQTQALLREQLPRQPRRGRSLVTDLNPSSPPRT